MVARTSSKAATLVAAYSLCSSTMLVVNKVAVRELPIPALVRCGRSPVALAAFRPRACGSS